MSQLLLLLVASFVAGLTAVSCAPDDPPAPNPVRGRATVEMTIAGQAFRLWVADDDDERERGLMHVTAEQMAALPDGTERGMIFVFPDARLRGFWMKDTIIPLDVAYVAPDGRVVNIYTMAPLDERMWQYPSDEPAQYAIEVNAGVFSRIGLTVGSRVEIPDSLLKHTP